MSQVSRQVGRPITRTASAQAKYETLKQNAKEATREFEAFEKQCIADGLLIKEKVGETPIKAHMRDINRKYWA